MTLYAYRLPTDIDDLLIVSDASGALVRLVFDGDQSD